MILEFLNDGENKTFATETEEFVQPTTERLILETFLAEEDLQEPFGDSDELVELLRLSKK